MVFLDEVMADAGVIADRLKHILVRDGVQNGAHTMRVLSEKQFLKFKFSLKRNIDEITANAIQNTTHVTKNRFKKERQFLKQLLNEKSNFFFFFFFFVKKEMKSCNII